MTVRRCQGRDCSAPVQLHENGDLRCSNGHSQPEAVGDLLRAMAVVVKDAMIPLRDRIEERFDTVEAQLEAIDLAPDPGVETGAVGLADAARIAGLSRDTMYRNAELYGGWKVNPELPKSQWRFDADRVRQGPSATAVLSSSRPRRRRSSVDLLPVKDRRA